MPNTLRMKDNSTLLSEQVLGNICVKYTAKCIYIYICVCVCIHNDG